MQPRRIRALSLTLLLFLALGGWLGLSLWGETGRSVYAFAPSQTPTLRLSQAVAVPGQEVTLTLTISGVSDPVYSADITLHYNAAVVEAISVAKGELTTGWSLASNLNTAGEIRIALAGTQPLSGDGVLAAIRFTVTGDDGMATDVTWARGDLNEGAIPSALQPGRITISSNPSVTQTIPLVGGWTLLSFNRITASAAVTEVMASVEGSYDRILGEDGSYVTTLPPGFNTLKEMSPGKAYWVHATSPVTLTLTGSLMPVDTPIELHTGWNWVGYLPQASMPVTQALASIEGKYTRVIGDDGSFVTSLPPSFNTLKTMEPGKGYLIYMTEASTLTYPGD